MPETTGMNELPPRATRGSRKWATLGGRTSSSTTRIPTNDTDTNETPSKTNGHQRPSSSLFRKASTISRTNDTPTTTDDPNVPTLKKSRSLMNVLRSKFNSPGVLRRFRSKSRESTKQTVTEISNQPSADPEPEIKPSNPEPTNTTTTRKSRKRDPSPIQRLANRITQFTRHHKTTSPDRQKKSPSKSITIDSHEEIRKSSSPLHNKDEVEHINACYDEIRAKYFTNTNKRNQSADEPHDRSSNTKPFNGSLLIDENSQRISSLLPTSDDPLLRARKQTNIKLNCLLSGYSLTTSFAHHEKLYGENNLFKFNHYYDVGKRKYDYNFTNENNRNFSNINNRRLSKSIDSFRRTNTQENEVPLKLEKLPPVDHEPFVSDEDQTRVSRLTANENELFICEDNDVIKTEANKQGNNSIVVEEEKKTHFNNEEQDEAFERDFQRALDRAIAVANKDENNSLHTSEDLRTTEQSTLNLVQITEQALSSFNNSPLFQNEEQNNDVSTLSASLEHTEPIAHTDEVLNSEQQPIAEDSSKVNTESSDSILEKPVEEKSPKVDVEKPTNENLVDIQESTKEGASTVAVDEVLKTSIESPVTEPPIIIVDEVPATKVETPVIEDLPKGALEELTKEEPLTVAVDEVLKTSTESPVTELPIIIVDEVPATKVETPITEDLPKIEIQESTKEEPSTVAVDEILKTNIAPPVIEDSTQLDTIELTKKEPPTLIIDEVPATKVETPITEDLPKVEVQEPTNEEPSTAEDSTKVDVPEPTTDEPSTLTDKETPTVDIEKSITEESTTEEPPSTVIVDEVSTTDIEKPSTEDSAKVDIQEAIKDEPSPVTKEEAPKVESEKATEEDLTKVNAAESTNEDLLNASIEKTTDDNSAKVPIEEPIKEELSTVIDDEASKVDIGKTITDDSEKVDVTPSTKEDLSNLNNQSPAVEIAKENSPTVDTDKSVDGELPKSTIDVSNEDISSVINELTDKVDQFLSEDSKNGQTFLVKLNAEEKILQERSEGFDQLLQTEDERLTEDVRTDINAVIGEVNLLLRGKLKQFRGLCEANVTKTSSGDPIPLDSDLEGFWDITYPLIDKVNEKFSKLDIRQANQWATIEEYDPNDVNNRPRHPDDRSKSHSTPSHKTSKIPIPKSANDDLKKLIQERRKATTTTSNQNANVEIFHNPK